MSEYIDLIAPELIEDPANTAPFVAKHTPHINIELIDGVARVTVQTGYYEPHPNELGHFFDWFELFAQGQSIARFSSTPAAVAPYFSTEVNLAPGTVLTAYAHCNLHGGWKAEASIPAPAE